VIIIAWDEDAGWWPFSEHKVFTVLLGDAIPEWAKNTTDNTAYTHYSEMTGVEENWDLGNLGLGDKDARSFFWGMKSVLRGKDGRRLRFDKFDWAGRRVFP